jgi:hypothetical protein
LLVGDVEGGISLTWRTLEEPRKSKCELDAVAGLEAEPNIDRREADNVTAAGNRIELGLSNSFPK